MAKILVCDDEQGLRQVLVSLLKPMGYITFQAEDGATAIATMKAEQPDLLLLDMRLPDMDGLEILAEAKKLHPSMPVVMLSGFGDVETAVGAIKRGAFDYLSKPFRVNDVKEVVQKALASGASAPAPAAAPASRVPNAAPAKAEPAAKASTGKKGGAPIVPLVVGVLVLALVGGLIAFKDKILPSAADQSFPVPYQNPTALCVAGDSLWVSDWVTESIYEHKLDETLSVKQIISLPGSHPTGITWDGTTLWTCNSWEGKIYKHQMDSKLTVIAEYDSPGPEPSGLFWDGVNLWVCDAKTAKFYQMRVTSDELTIVNEYNSPGQKPIGLFNDGYMFWSADTDTNKIYQHAKDARFTVNKILVAAPFKIKNLVISGLAFDGKSVWTCADEHARIYRLNPKKFEQVKF